MLKSMVIGLHSAKEDLKVGDEVVFGTVKYVVKKVLYNGIQYKGQYSYLVERVD